MRSGSGGEPTRAELIERNLPLVESVARRFQRRGEPLDDLVQVGTIGLIKAVDRFDPARGTRFATVAVPAIEGEIKHHLRDGAPLVRKPQPLHELAVRARAEQTRMTAELGREPTIDELAGALGAPHDEVVLALDGGPAVAIADDDAKVPGAAHAGESRLLLDGGLDRLPERDRRVLRMRYEEDLSQAEIAKREGVSQATVSRQIAGALERLRRTLQTGEGVAEGEGESYSRPVAATGQAAEPAKPEAEKQPSHSGRLLVRMPASLHDALADAAEREGVSLNSLVTGALAGSVGWRDPTGELRVPHADPVSEERPPWLRRALIANVIVIGLAALAAIGLLIAAWAGGF